MNSNPSSSQCPKPSPGVHCTPPPRPFKVKNPFERTLVERLNSHVCSPGMFTIRESSNSFKWDIEQVSILKPADIVACSSQFEPTPDPILERKATEAIEKYFSQEMIVPSPFDEAPKRKPLPLNVVENMTSECTKFTAWSQTNLSFPAVLPPEVESVLKPFYKDQNCSGDADISANASLRRKLCFEGDFSDEEDCALYVEKHRNNEIQVQRGLKRSLELSPKSADMSQDQIDDLFDVINRKPMSPILKTDFKTRYESCEEVHLIKSPSLSPIHRSSASSKKDSEESPVTSLKNNSHHGDSSLFSQSTPEKSPNSNANSSQDVFDTSEMHLIKMRFNDDIRQMGKNNLKLNKRSQSDLSLLFNKHKNSSVVNMDISSDGSACGTRNFSNNNSEIDDSFDSMSLQNQMLNDMEIPTSDFNFRLSKKDNVRLDENNCLPLYSRDENKENRNDVTKVNDCSTPTKYGYGKNLNLYTTPVRSSHFVSMQDSPMQISLNNSLENDIEKIIPKNKLISNVKEKTLSVSEYENSFKFNMVTMEESKLMTSGFKRMDSGYLDNFDKFNSFQSSIPFNSMKHTSINEDMTKSFQNNTASSTSRWKRFDSGFHDETSSDFVHHMSYNDSMKFGSRKHCAIAEGRREVANFDESNLFGDDTVPFMNCNFSSTPSKMQLKKH